VPAFINAVRGTLIQSDSFRDEVFDENDMKLTDNKILFKEFQAEKIVFCDGVKSLQGKFFNSVPIRALKGETISVQIEQPINRIYNRGVYIVPTQVKNAFKAGSTYNAKDKSETVTEESRVELIEKLNSLLNIPYKVLGQDWGFRPTTPDRKPILGSHPSHPNLVMFNGMGTKGVSQAPFFSNQLADWLTGVAEIDEVVDLSRFS
jgi:glycine oxidase